MRPVDLHCRFSHETIDNGIDAMSRGELRKQLIACLKPALSQTYALVLRSGTARSDA